MPIKNIEFPTRHYTPRELVNGFFDVKLIINC